MPAAGNTRHAVTAIATGRGQVARQAAALEGALEILVLVIVVVLALALAGGPLPAMRNPAEADKLTPGADPAHESGKEPDASESTAQSPTPRPTAARTRVFPGRVGPRGVK